jgi:hypothetical protein
MSNYAYVGAGGHNMIRSSSISLLKIAAWWIRSNWTAHSPLLSGWENSNHKMKIIQLGAEKKQQINRTSDRRVKRSSAPQDVVSLYPSFSASNYHFRFAAMLE